MLLDLLALVPAFLAGVGGALLGDRIGGWIQQKARTTEES